LTISSSFMIQLDCLEIKGFQKGIYLDKFREIYWSDLRYRRLLQKLVSPSSLIVLQLNDYQMKNFNRIYSRWREIDWSDSRQWRLLLKLIILLSVTISQLNNYQIKEFQQNLLRQIKSNKLDWLKAFKTIVEIDPV